MPPFIGRAKILKNEVHINHHQLVEHYLRFHVIVDMDDEIVKTLQVHDLTLTKTGINGSRYETRKRGYGHDTAVMSY